MSQSAQEVCTASLHRKSAQPVWTGSLHSQSAQAVLQKLWDNMCDCKSWRKFLYTGCITQNQRYVEYLRYNLKVSRSRHIRNF